MARSGVNDVVTEIPSHQISFDVEAFDEALRSQGVRFVHYEAMRCPVGLADLGDLQQHHPDHEGCTNGFIYSRAGVVTALFVGNSKSKKSEDIGYWDGSTVQVTIPRFYDDQPERPVHIAPFDRLYLEEEAIVVPTWQLYLHHESNRDRLKYPVVSVLRLKDNRGEEYYQGQDFQVSQNGLIAWGGGRSPAAQLEDGPSPANDRGALCSVRYVYRPYWYVGQLLHEIRVSQVSREDGTRGIVRFPQAVLLHREYVGHNRDQKEPGAPGVDADLMRTVLGPMNGGFGPR